MNYKNLISPAFVRQIDENDCGVACLAMIMNLCGLNTRVPFIRNQVYIPRDGLSLLQLCELAKREGMKAECVELDVEFIRSNPNPCILLLNNAQGSGHYQVCCRFEKNRTGHRYLMADPAVGIYYLEERELLAIWPARAALYFNELQITRAGYRHYISASILALRVYPKMFLIAIPFLNCCILLFGATTSWMLQKLIDRSIAQTQENLFVIIVSLLLFINLFKNLTGFVRQLLLTHFSSDVKEKLITLFADDLAAYTIERKLSMTERSLKYIMNEIEKINTAVTVLIANLMSDGFLALLLVSGIAYCDPVCGLVNSTYVAIACGITIVKLPGWARARLDIGKRYSEAEGQLAALVRHQLISDQTASAASNDYKLKYLKYLGTSKIYAGTTGKTILVIECLGTLDVIIVFAKQAIECIHQQTTFGTAMLTVLFSYMITTLVPKICDAIVTVNQGALSLRQFRFNISAKF